MTAIFPAVPVLVPLPGAGCILLQEFDNRIANLKYIFYNPMAVQTPGMAYFRGPLMKLAYKFMGEPVKK